MKNYYKYDLILEIGVQQLNRKHIMNDLYLTRVTLIGNIKENDEEAWREFCVFYWDVITGWARRMGCSDAVAKDVFQETIVSLMRQLPKFDYDLKKGRFRAFLKTIVKRRVYDIYRKEGRYVNPVPEDSEGTDSDIAVFDKIIQKNSKNEITYDSDLIWLDSILKLAIKNVAENMDPTTYLSFKLYVLEERPVEEVINATRIDKIGTVYQHKSRFLSALKKEFYNLIEAGEGENLDISKVGEKLFNQTLSHVVSGRTDLKTTIVDNKISDVLMERLNIVRSLIDDLKLSEETRDNVLIILEKNKEKSVKLKSNISIGRLEKNEIQFDYDDVSSLHATLAMDENNEIVLKDEFSTNGTFLNGERINEPKKIIKGDIIQVGSEAAIVLI